MNDSNPVYFTVTSTPLPTGWLDQDIGQVGIVGSAGYSSNVFTIQGGGSTFLSDTADAFHFAYVPLSGDGTITARVTGVSTNYAQAGVMIRETLTAASNHMFMDAYAGSIYEAYRTTTGSNSSYAYGGGGTLPIWLKAVRSGNAFTGYTSPDGQNWTQVGTSQTIAMAPNVYMGLAVSGTTSSPYSATFDNVSTTSTGGGGDLPIISLLSPTAGGIGSSVTISGSSFGSIQGSSTLSFNGTLASTISSWSDNQIVASVPNGATTGPVSLAVNSIQNTCSGDCQFTVINPVISALTPPAAQVGGTVTISGSGFGSSQGSSLLQFSGTSASVTSWTNTSITAVVPSGATSGPVTVVDSGITSNSAQFTVLEPLSITSISPAIGPVGSSVTITGAGFGSAQSNSVISFYGAAAAVTSWSDTQIVATVPAAAGSGPVSVEVAGITSQGPSFTINATNQTTDSLGNASSYTSVVSAGQWLYTDGEGSGCSSCTSRGVKHHTYDVNGNLLTATDELGNATTYIYDSNSNTASVSKQLSTNTPVTTSYTHNSFGEVLSSTDPLGNVTTNSYDANGNLLSVTSPAPNGNTAAGVTQFQYAGNGELTQITDPLGHITTLTYTSVGLIASITDAQQNTTTYQYDVRGNRTAVIDPINGSGHPTTFAYDVMNRLTGITYPDGSTVGFGYDYRGRRTSVTDQNNRATTYAYDDADRLTTVTDPASHVTTYTYDTENNLKSITDANSHTTSFSYDAYGRVTQTAFPSSWSESYAYDGVGNLTSKTDRNGNTIQYVYDALYRMTQKSYSDSTSVEYAYDLAGKVLQVNDPTGTYGLAYDNMGRLTGTTTQYSYLPGVNFQNAYTYDAASKSHVPHRARWQHQHLRLRHAEPAEWHGQLVGRIVRLRLTPTMR
jgi:YD repeat-containing protein